MYTEKIKAWQDLPNADIIVLVMSDVAENTAKWVKGWRQSVKLVAANNQYDLAWDKVNLRLDETGRRSVQNHLNLELSCRIYFPNTDTHKPAELAACDAVFALACWDSSRDLFNLDIRAVETIALLGNHAAILLLPAFYAGFKFSEKSG